MDVDVLFYVAAVHEARVNIFLSELAALPDVQRVALDRGFQRIDETEPFGYRDGVRNIHPDVRTKFVFIHRDGAELDEPVWAEGGTYMAFMRILQRPEQFAALPDDATRDRVIGRTKDGTRLDLVGQGVHPHDEPPEPLPALDPTSHVGRAGPRGKHDDVQIFRRGLPFMEVSPEGALRVGLNFCSFQASLDQFDVVFNDWMMSRQFPPQAGGEEPGVDALMDPSAQLTSIEKVGFFFVPPYEQDGLVAAVFNDHKERARKTGRLVVHKRVTDPNDPTRRFERGRFRFDLRDAVGQLVQGSEFSTDSTGRGICPVELPMGQQFVLNELFSPVPNIGLTQTPFVMDRANKQLQVLNQVTQPNTPYGG